MNEFNAYQPLVLDALLINMLKEEGILINAAAAIEIHKIIQHTDLSVANSFTRLKYRLTPLISRNKEEQEIMYRIFDRLDEKFSQKEEKVKSLLPEEPIIVPPEPPPSLIKKIKTYTKKIALPVGLCLIFIAAIWIFRHKIFPPPPRPVLDITHTDAVVDSPVVFSAFLFDTVVNSNYKVEWNFSDTIISDVRTVTRIFDSTGNFDFTADLKRGNDIVNTTSFSVTVLCEPFPSVLISEVDSFDNNNQEANRNSKERPYSPQKTSDTAGNRQAAERQIKKRYTAVFNNPSKESSRYRYDWYVNDIRKGQERDFSYTKNGNEYNFIRLKVDCKGIHCSTDSLTDSMKEQPLFVSYIDPGAKPINLSAAVAWRKVIPLAAFLLLFPAIIGWIIYRFLFKTMEKADDSGQYDRNITLGTDEPYSIQFSSQDHLINNESGVNKLADTLRKRQSSDILKLNIPQTIKTHITSGGLPELAFSSMTKPSDYLVFIDKEYEDSHLTRLFNYLVNKLRREQVTLTVYEYYKEPLFLSNPDLNHIHIPVDRIAALYPDTTLFIFGQSHHFISPIKETLKIKLIDKLNLWPTKFFITGFSSPDWGRKERMLSAAGFTVIPADVYAQTAIAKIIFGHATTGQKQLSGAPYPSRFINFSNTQTLKEYFKDNPALFLWVCALAVYPRPDWNLTLAIGNAIENEIKKTDPAAELVTYTNLLKIGRISWMHDNRFTETLRLEMLKQLDAKTQAIARQTLLEQLALVKKHLTASSLVKQEFEVHETFNSFLLDLYNGRPVSHETAGKVKSMIDKDHIEQSEIIFPNPLIKSRQVQKVSLRLTEYFAIRRRQKIKSIAIAAFFTGLLLCLFAFGVAKTSEDFFRLKEQKPLSQTFIFKNNVTPRQSWSVTIAINDTLKSYEVLSDTTITIDSLRIQDTLRYGLFLISESDDPQTVIQDSFQLNRSEYTVSIANPVYTPVHIYYNGPIAENISDELEQNLPAYFSIRKEETVRIDTGFRVFYFDSAMRINAERCANTINSLFVQQIKVEPGDSAYFKLPSTAIAIQLPNRRTLNKLLPVNDSAKKETAKTWRSYQDEGDKLLKQRNYRLAIAKYDSAILLNTRNVLGYYNRGLSYENLNNYTAAIQNYNQAIRLNGRDALSYYRKASIEFQQKNYTAAINDYSKVIEINSPYIRQTNSDALFYRGECYRNTGNITAACYDYEEAGKSGNGKASSAVKKYCDGGITPSAATILWVDDHPENNETLIKKFESLNIKITLAQSNSQALSIVSLREKTSNSFDLIISDIGRDKEGNDAGLKLAKSIKGRSRYKPPFIFYTSGDQVKGFTKDAEALGALLITNYPAELEATVRRLFISKNDDKQAN